MPYAIGITVFVFVMLTLVLPIGWAAGPFVAIPIALLAGGMFASWGFAKQWYLRRTQATTESSSGLVRDYESEDANLPPGRDVGQPQSTQLEGTPQP